MKLIAKDISIFFMSQCCQKSTDGTSKPCRISAQKIAPHDYFKFWYNKGTDVICTTITIGKKWLGRKSADDQYKQFVKDIKRAYPFHGKTKYVYHFELQNNGHLHAHGLEIDGYNDTFICAFADYGSRNKSKEAYQKCRNIDGYCDYINKDNEYPPIHNILKKEIREIEQTRMGGSPKNQGN